jgi:ribonuclease HII
MKTIQQIKKEWSQLPEEKREVWMESLKNDPRKGVQRFLAQLEKEKEKEKELKLAYRQMTNTEEELYAKGFQYIAGVDEVGRGPLAGPVVAASVILPKDCYIPRLNDSKKLSPKVREELYEEIIEKAVAVGIGMVSAQEIDHINIYEATKQAMIQSVQALTPAPDVLLIDALQLNIPIPQMSLIKGDSRSVSIAAASIVAKVTRDRWMKRLAKIYPDYGFEQHMGYGTKQHIQAIQDYGICIEHRKSFSPIKEMIQSSSY